MKNILLAFVLIICALPMSAQEKIESSLAEAKTSYESKDLQSTRFALESALRELDILIGNEILKILPESFEDYGYKKDEDMVMGSSGGITGLNIERNYYKSEDRQDNITLIIMNDSPMLSMVSSFLTNPLFMNAADGDQKVVKINGYKALLSKEEQENDNVGYTIQIPFGQSLLTLDCNRISDQSKAISYAEAIDLKAIMNLAGSN